MPQWDTQYTEYGDEKTTPTEMEYGEMMGEPHPDVDDIGSFDNYIVVTVKLEDETNSVVNIATVKQSATDANGFTIG